MEAPFTSVKPVFTPSHTMDTRVAICRGEEVVSSHMRRGKRGRIGMLGAAAVALAALASTVVAERSLAAENGLVYVVGSTPITPTSQLPQTPVVRAGRTSSARGATPSTTAGSGFSRGY